MKKLIISLVVLALSVPAAAGDYTIGFFTDENATSCEITNVEPAVIRVHMLLYGDAEIANTVTFYAPTPECWDADWLGDEIDDDFLFLGSSHSETFGLSIAFGGCRELPVRLGSMSFWARGSDPCCTYAAYPLPFDHVEILEVVDCTRGVHEASHESVIINPNVSCGCTASTVVATEQTSWGRVKSLYR